MAPRYKVTLTEEERGSLEMMTRSGKISAKKFLHARILLLCDASEYGDPWTVAKVAEAMEDVLQVYHLPMIRLFQLSAWTNRASN